MDLESTWADMSDETLVAECLACLRREQRAPFGDRGAMQQHCDRLQAWLEEQGKTHLWARACREFAAERKRKQVVLGKWKPPTKR